MHFTSVMHLDDEIIHIFHGTKQLIYVFVVAYVITIVDLWRFVNRIQPEDFSTEFVVKIVELLSYACGIISRY